ncbi:hypothetical protein CDAR_551601 [Caerostris darwini]|uniref:Uncharacterized protein n=1 Tax=Caerostris darwini TaxID=1538125 RepID=A0AAV4V692_9ARAC|nr:hypothetical protein CDAR_551601 [Caerostris darwini]
MVCFPSLYFNSLFPASQIEYKQREKFSNENSVTQPPGYLGAEKEALGKPAPLAEKTSSILTSSLAIGLMRAEKEAIGSQHPRRIDQQHIDFVSCHWINEYALLISIAFFCPGFLFRGCMIGLEGSRPRVKGGGKREVLKRLTAVLKGRKGSNREASTSTEKTSSILTSSLVIGLMSTPC